MTTVCEVDEEIEEVELTPEICLTNALEHFYQESFGRKFGAKYASKFLCTMEDLDKVFGWIICTIPMDEDDVKATWRRIEVYSADQKAKFGRFMQRLLSANILPEELIARWNQLV